MRRNVLATALVAAAVFAMPAQAQTFQFGLERTSPNCTAFAANASFNYTSCLGSFDGNNLNQNLTSALNSFGAGTLTFRGSSNEATTFGPFTTNPTGTTGTLTFDSPISGPFAIVLKAGDQFSIYYFANMAGTVSSLTYNTIGTNTNSQGIANGLSHATLYGGRMGVVPEPSTYALMATGLLGLGAAARRRRKA